MTMTNPTPISAGKPAPTAKDDPRRQGPIILNYGDIGNSTLGDALKKLDNFTGWKDPKDIHRFNKFKDSFDREEKKAGAFYKKLVDRHAVMEPVLRKNKETEKMEPVMDPKTGKPVMRPKWGPGGDGSTTIMMKDPKAWEKDADLFHAHEFSIKVFKFTSDDFVRAELTPAEIRACAKMLGDIDEDLLIDTSAQTIGDDQEVPEGLEALFPPEPTDTPTEEPATDGRTDQSPPA